MTTIEIRPHRVVAPRLVAALFWLPMRLLDAEFRIVIDGTPGHWTRRVFARRSAR